MSKYILIIFFTLITISCKQDIIIPSDKELISQFKENEDLYEKLKLIIINANVFRIEKFQTSKGAKWFVHPEVGENVYNKLISNIEKIQYLNIITSSQKKSAIQINFPIFRSGVSIGGQVKGVAFVTNIRGFTVLNDLDNLLEKKFDLLSNQTYLKHIDGNWYLYFYYDD